MPTTYVKTLPVKKENSLKGGGLNKGNGADKHMPIGLANDGDVYRGLLKFTLDWSNVYRIVQAVLCFKSTQEVHVTFGAGPTVEVQRCSEYWNTSGGSEGQWVTGAGAYPGPSVTGSTYTGGPWGTATGAFRRIDITTLVDLWAPAAVLTSAGSAGTGTDNHGLRLKAPNEGTTADRYEIHGSRASYVGQQPYIELHYISNHPPNAPAVTSPETDDPAIVGSTNADTLPIDFLFSDTDSADTCAYVAIEVYGDGATDGALGTRVAGVAGPPTALGSINAYRGTITRGNVDSGQTFSARTNYRYRIATMDNEGTWGAWTGLADGRFLLGYAVQAPAQLYMDPLTDDPHL
ncbi:MAG TPA: hypothetical protein VMW48_13185, partial [Vicinamibacterales bacterium]|nr:hypothetical protein [Vicinamibacterales bacterium]